MESSVGSFVRRSACAQPAMVSCCGLGLAADGMSGAGSFRCDRGVAGALCWFVIVVAARSRLFGGCAVARIDLAGYALVV